jgi:hypothetical protein
LKLINLLIKPDCYHPYASITIFQPIKSISNSIIKSSIQIIRKWSTMHFIVWRFLNIMLNNIVDHHVILTLFGGQCTINCWPSYRIQINFASKNLITIGGQLIDHWDQVIAYNVNYTVKMKTLSFDVEYHGNTRYKQIGEKK